MGQIRVTETQEGLNGILNLTAQENKEESLNRMSEEDGTKNIEDTLGINCILEENPLPGIESLLTTLPGDDSYSG